VTCTINNNNNMQIEEEENWPSERMRANISKITKVQAVTHYTHTDHALFTSGAPLEQEGGSEGCGYSVSDWPEKHSVFALWKHVRGNII
jgi:hypothetical protein